MSWIDMATRALRLYAAADRSFERARLAVRDVVGEVAIRGLTEDELERVTQALYRAAGPVNEGNLFEWERDWFSRELPRPPASLLLGGAGYGREAVPLKQLGYHLVAFEPEPTAAHTCRQRLGDPTTVIVARYQDLPAGMEGRGPLASLQGKRFDGVILGWGSFGHLRQPSHRRQTLEVLARLTVGPILVSFVDPPPAHSRSAALGVVAGSCLRRLRRLAEHERLDLWFAPWCGFVSRISREEIATTTRALERSVRWGPPGPFTRVALISKP